MIIINNGTKPFLINSLLKLQNILLKHIEIILNEMMIAKDIVKNKIKIKKLQEGYFELESQLLKYYQIKL